MRFYLFIVIVGYFNEGKLLVLLILIEDDLVVVNDYFGEIVEC